ncbi:hypothetical protein QYF36_012923 [Acer negundo]|nr:hypothetical protein QYF36_012923 [Acer negundo]
MPAKACAYKDDISIRIYSLLASTDGLSSFRPSMSVLDLDVLMLFSSVFFGFLGCCFVPELVFLVNSQADDDDDLGVGVIEEDDDVR